MSSQFNLLKIGLCILTTVSWLLFDVTGTVLDGWWESVLCIVPKCIGALCFVSWRTMNCLLQLNLQQ